jgi:hypothetical protein
MSTEGDPGRGWSTETVRLTLLTSSRPVGRIWQRLTGEEPDSATDQPRVPSVREQGTFQSGILVTEVRPDRTDIVLSATPMPTAEVPSLGLAPEVLDGFARLCVSWTTKFPIENVLRVALGAIYLMPIDSRTSGYQELRRFLPFELDPAAFDFFYQINRRRTSRAIQGLDVNRLSRWSVAQWQILQGGLPGPLTLQTAGLPTACRLELDVNTVPEFAAGIAPLQIPAIVNELVSLVTEIATRGDVP